MNESKMRDAYYYGFDSTGVSEIDNVLNAVGLAGKMYHHTDGWNEKLEFDAGMPGDTCVEIIQNAANEAAKFVGNMGLPDETTKLKAALSKIYALSRTDRHEGEKDWEHVRMFCEEAGVPGG